MKKGNFKEFYDDSEIAQNYETRKEKIEGGGLIMKGFDEAYFLDRTPQWLREFYRKIDNFCINEMRAGVKKEFLNTYLRYNTPKGQMFLKLKSKLGCLKIYPKLKYSELEQPPRWLRDYFAISHQTWCEAIIREEDLLEETIILDVLFGLIKNAFNQVRKHPKKSKVSIEKPVKVLPNLVYPTKMKLDLEIGTDGFVMVGLRVHKSQLTKVIEKLL